MDVFNEILSNAQLVNFGSGPSAYDFDYSDSEFKGFNFGMAPSCFALERLLLSQVGGHIKKGCAVAIAVCPFSFAKNNGYDNDRRFLNYYGVLTEENLKKAPKRALRYNPDLKEEAPKNIWFPYGLDLSQDAVSYEELTIRTNEMTECWKSQMELTDFINSNQKKAHKKAFEIEKADMLGFLSDCIGLGLRPFIVLPPIFNGLRKNISDEFFYAFVYNNLTDLPNGITVLDYTKSELFGDEDFSDCVFLNRKGARRFTQSVFEKTRQ